MENEIKPKKKRSASSAAPRFPLLGNEAAAVRLAAALAAGHAAQAYLLTGRAGIGRRRFAEEAAALAVCARRAGADRLGGCGACGSCRAREAGVHPDILTIEPPPTKRLIPIAAIRGSERDAPETRRTYPVPLDRFLSLVPALAAARVAIVDPADALGEQAANAMLKALEEPPPGTIFFLIAASTDSVLPTIRSRAQEIRLRPAAPERLAAWLSRHAGLPPARAAFAAHVAGGAPGAAVRLVEEEAFTAFGAMASLAAAAPGRPMDFAARLLAWAEGDAPVPPRAAGGGKRKSRPGGKEEARERLRTFLDFLLYAASPGNRLGDLPETAPAAVVAPGRPMDFVERRAWREAILRAHADLDANVFLPLVVGPLASALFGRARSEGAA